MSQIKFILTADIESIIMCLTESIFRLLTDLQKEAQMLKYKEDRSSLYKELFRIFFPISVVKRGALGVMEICGKQISEGKILHLFIAYVNRDSNYFPYPNEVSPENLETQYLVLGIGRYHCLGTKISKM